MNSPITYFADAFANISLEDIDAAHKWENFGAPRSESYYAKLAIPYTYGRGTGERTYQPHLLKDEPESVLTEVWGTLDLTQESYGIKGFELLFCNRYADQHQHLGWHADDSSAIDITRPIAVVTFGAEREIWFKEQGANSTSVEKLKLEHGSLLFMKAGMQQTHFHRIPKHDRPCGPRVSLTFRGLAPGFESFEDKH
jgi:alkylated DNA repair dioxygenase AlkB